MNDAFDPNGLVRRRAIEAADGRFRVTLKGVDSTGFLVEVAERVTGYYGLGAANAPISIAAAKRLLRQTGAAA